MIYINTKFYIQYILYMPLVKKELPAEGMINGKKVHGRRICQMIVNIMINELCEDMERKVEKRVEWRMLSSQ